MIGCLAGIEARGRTWTDEAGHTVDAELTGTTNGMAVLKLANGRIFKTDVAKLSQQDQAYITAQQGGSTGTSTADAPTEPGLSPGFVGHPEFDYKGGTLGGGTAFYAEGAAKGDVILVTAHHIFGPACGLAELVPQKDMPGFARKVGFDDLTGAKHFSAPADFVPGLEKSEADVAAYRFPMKPGLNPHKFATRNPAKDEAIWLVARLQDRPKDELLHRGIVDGIWPDKFRCRFDNGNLIMRGASGAPYINARGEIVGLHSSSWKDPGKVAGSVVPVETIRTALGLNQTK